MRLFIAIDIDQKTKDALVQLQQKILNRVNIRKTDVKWVDPESTHLTLKFLGDVRDEEIAPVCDVVKDVAGRFKSFELGFEQVGSFGGRRARVLWVGTAGGTELLSKLQAELENELARIGLAAEAREFAGHLTLCRIRNPKAGLKLAEVSKNYKNFKLSTIPVDSVVVYQSELKPDGPVYTRLANYKLCEP
ncbi:RNA 2',3'-cyclic phosphodiesterase [Planctomycetota bacterium]